MGKCRKASKRRRQPQCLWCEHIVRRGVDQHLKRCQVFQTAVTGAMERNAESWTVGQFLGIPRCVQFPHSGPCCGRYDEEGNLTGFCPPP